MRDSRKEIEKEFILLGFNIKKSRKHDKKLKDNPYTYWTDKYGYICHCGQEKRYMNERDLSFNKIINYRNSLSNI